MPSRPSSLPDDIDALKALLMQRDGEVQQLRAMAGAFGRKFLGYSLWAAGKGRRY